MTRPRTSPRVISSSSWPRAPAPDRHDVAVVEEAHLADSLDRQRLLTAPRELEERTALGGRRTADGAAGEQVAGAQRRAVDGEVRELLAGCPVRRRVRRSGHDRAAAGSLEHELEVEVERPRVGVGEVGERTRVLRRWGDPGRATSASSGVTQAETLVAKDLPRKGPSGTYSHAWMSRADQSSSRHDAEDVVGERAPRARACRAARARPTTKPTSTSTSRRREGPKDGRVLVRRLALPVRAHDVGAAHDHRAGAAVVADGQVLPVRASARSPSGRKMRPTFVAWCSEE